MRIRTLAAAVALGSAAVGLSACATGLNTKVSRYQAATIPAGASFYVVPKEGTPSARFYHYASMVSQQLQAKGFRPAGAPQAADMLVKLDYSVDEGKTEYVTDRPFGPTWGSGFGYGYRYNPYGYRYSPYGWAYRDPFYDPSWGIYYGRPYWSRYSRSPFYYGWDDPFWYSSPYAGYGASRLGYGYGGVREYTVYKAYLDMDIVRRADNAPLFEGQAQARSQTDEESVLIPNLIQAMFTGFPGRSGETVKITVPAKKR